MPWFKKVSTKIALSLFVIVSFVVYSWHQRNESASVPVQPIATPASTNTVPVSSSASLVSPTSKYKDGEYIGQAADAFYGFIQVKSVISGGKITDVVFLQYPNDRSTSVRINEQAMPLLKQEAIQAQTSQVDGISGATDTSEAFVKSLASALNQAQR